MKYYFAIAALIAVGSTAVADTNTSPEDVLSKTSCDVLLWPEKLDALTETEQFAIAGFLLGLGAQTTSQDQRIGRADYGIAFVADICGQFNSLTIWEAARIAIMTREINGISR